MSDHNSHDSQFSQFFDEYDELDGISLDKKEVEILNDIDNKYIRTLSPHQFRKLLFSLGKISDIAYQKHLDADSQKRMVENTLSQTFDHYNDDEYKRYDYKYYPPDYEYDEKLYKHLYTILSIVPNLYVPIHPIELLSDYMNHVKNWGDVYSTFEYMSEYFSDIATELGDKYL